MLKKTPLPFLLVFFALFSCNDIPQHITTGLEGKPLPSVDLLMIDSTTHINTANAKPGVANILTLHRSKCASSVSGNSLTLLFNENKLSQIQFYIITVSAPYKLDSYSKVVE